MLICCQLDPKDTFQWNFNQISGTFVQDNAWLKILAVCTSISSHFQYMDLSLFFRLEHLLYEIKKNPKTLAGCYLDWMEYKTDGNNTCHDDVMMYMETLSASLTLCEGNPSFTDGFPVQGAGNAWIWYFLVVCLNSVVEPAVVAGDLQYRDAYVTSLIHYSDVIMTTMVSQIISLTIIYSTVYQNSALLAFVWGIHRDRWIPRTKGQ